MLSRITFFLCLLFSITSNANTGIQLNQQFAKRVEQQFAQNSIPGGAYVIVKHDQVLALETFGYTDTKKQHAVNANTVFRLASVSKTFAATVTTLLAQENKLKLTDPITQYVPYFQLAKQGAAEQIQIQHLLSHSAGLMPNAYDNMLHENWSLAKIIKRFDRLTPVCPVDKCYGYQNIAYAMLEPAIEASQPHSYAQLLQQRLFTPLNMQQASVGYHAFKQSNNTAKPHILKKRIKSGKKDKYGDEISQQIWRTVNVSKDYYKVAPAAGVNASISDMSKWLIANMGYQPNILPPAVLSEMTTPRIRTKRDLKRKYWRKHLQDAHYGYGWRIYQLHDFPIVYHSGWVAGFRAEVGYSPKLGIGFAMLLNAESNVVNKLSIEFWQQAEQLTADNLTISQSDF